MNGLVGFRFQPTDEEIIFLLKMKRLDPDFSVHTITEIDFYNFEPWELPRFSVIQSKEEVWHFYCEPNKYAKSTRAHRSTKTGYWKVTGQGSKMKAKKSHDEIGNKKILSFCSSNNPKTEWVMHEISVGNDSVYKKDFVICRLERKRDKKLRISTSDENQSSPDLGSCSSIDVAENVFSESPIPVYQPMVSNRNQVAENTCSKLDNSISHPRNHVAENTSPESILSPNQHLVSNDNYVAENICAEPRPLDGYNGLNNASPIHPEQESSYSSGSSYDCDLLISHFYNERVDDLINSLRAFQNESSHEEPGQTFTPDFKSSKSDEYAREATGQTFSPDFNSSKSDGVVYVKNSSDMDTETFCAWTEAVFDYKQIHSILE